MTIVWHVVGYCIGYGMGYLWEAMTGHMFLVPNIGTE